MTGSLYQTNEFRRRSIAARRAATATQDKDARTTYEVLAAQWTCLAEAHERVLASRNLLVSSAWGSVS